MSETEATSAESGGAADETRRTSSRRWLVPALLVGFVAMLAFDAVPSGTPAYFFDSKAYQLWPEMPGPGGELIPSKRPPSYPLTLDLLGHGRLLAWVQAWGLLSSFLALGWVLARGTGVVVLGLVARSLAVSAWGEAVLTEALSLATLALLLALALWLGARRRGAGAGTAKLDAPATIALVAAGVLAVYLTFLRDANFLLLPLFGVAFVRGPWRVAVAAALLGVALAATSFTLSEREQRSYPNIATAIGVRLRADREAFAELKAAGMPVVVLGQRSAELDRWLGEGGRAAYQRWVLTRPASYVEPLPELVARGISAGLRQRYFESAPVSSPATRVGDATFQLLAPPVWLWLGLLAVPLVEWRRRGAVTATGALAALGVPIAYGFAFATYHAAAIEVTRHMLMAIVLYRLSTVAGLVALARVFRPHGTGTNDEPSSPLRRRDPAHATRRAAA